ncbi:hypothetical protein [Raineya orbicola]|jgi:hypothetical protein|uniref:Uncharacterized protein n=1 Tax=Raineya orbicola TaxID=2016530 RepID=A0A2N3IAD6_9BACT|nr:hypothetical protein [Raineya orbicola]PKQ67259.1 hypothetical protein Rain11_2121 [Raineya orbicola]
MQTLKIKVLNPKVFNILQDLADLNLISIQEAKETTDLLSILEKIRSVTNTPPSLEEITKEVEMVRNERYSKKSD